MSGSGMVLARYEYMQELNILCCLGVMLVSNTLSERHFLRIAALLLLLLSCISSTYSHLQGLLYLPLTIYLGGRYCAPMRNKCLNNCVMVILFVWIAVVCVRFHQSSCVEYPEIERFWAQMTLEFSKLQTANFPDWLSIKYYKYIEVFQYKKSYQIAYLPGVGGEMGAALSMLNEGVKLVVTLNLLFVFIISIMVPTRLLWLALTVRRHRANSEPNFCAERLKICFLLSIPAVFLFIYDSSHNFYRSFYVNFLSAIAVSLFLCQLRLRSLKYVISGYSFICGLLVIASVVANYYIFFDKLKGSPGYEGPSISINRDWGSIRNDVNILAKECRTDLSLGGVIVDDMTYDALKYYPKIYPVTYLLLQAGVSKIGMNELLTKISPRFAIARCAYLQSIPVIEMQHRRGELCCVNFLERNVKAGY